MADMVSACSKAHGGGGAPGGTKGQRGETQAARASAQRTAQQGWARHQIVEHN